MVMSDIPLTLVLQNKANEIHQRHGKGKHKRKKKRILAIIFWISAKNFRILAKIISKSIRFLPQNVWHIAVFS